MKYLILLLSFSIYGQDLYQNLEKEVPGSKNYFEIYKNIQNNHFKNQQWDKFFGFAQYYRENFLTSSKEVKKNFQPNLLGLEIIALGKHCQFGPAKNVYNEVKTILALSDSKIKKNWDEVSKKLNLMENFPTILATTKTPDKLPGFKSGKVFWPTKSFKNAKSPRQFRTKVENKCMQKST